MSSSLPAPPMGRRKPYRLSGMSNTPAPIDTPCSSARCDSTINASSLRLEGRSLTPALRASVISSCRDMAPTLPKSSCGITSRTSPLLDPPICLRWAKRLVGVVRVGVRVINSSEVIAQTRCAQVARCQVGLPVKRKRRRRKVGVLSRRIAVCLIPNSRALERCSTYFRQYVNE